MTQTRNDTPRAMAYMLQLADNSSELPMAYMLQLADNSSELPP